jgi:hypothetical protein
MRSRVSISVRRGTREQIPRTRCVPQVKFWDRTAEYSRGTSKSQRDCATESHARNITQPESTARAHLTLRPASSSPPPPFTQNLLPHIPPLIVTGPVASLVFCPAVFTRSGPGGLSRLLLSSYRSAHRARACSPYSARPPPVVTTAHQDAAGPPPAQLQP